MKWRLLADVPDHEVRMLLMVARRRRFARGEVVFHRDDPADSLHLISSGHFLARIMTPLGDTITVALLGPGDTFGEMALVVTPEARRAATVEALEPAETFAVYQTDFAQLRKEHPSIDQILIALLAGQIRTLDERLLEALYLPSEKRVLRRLVDLALVYGNGEGSTETELPFTQEDLASFAGSSRATVNRVLRDEQKRGTVELQRGKTRVLDLEALRKRAR